MIGNLRPRLWLLLGAVQLAALAAGCAGPKPAMPGAGVTVTPVERIAWDHEPEGGLYRITFDAERALRIRREAELGAAAMDAGSYNTEKWALEEAAERELRARGLCDGSTKLLRLAEHGSGQSGVTGIFKCRPPVF